jgi:hypothetical protein
MTAPDISSQAIYTLTLTLRRADPDHPLYDAIQSAVNKLIAQLERIDDLETELEFHRSLHANQG